MNTKVLVGLSGGVDSSVAAALLSDAGYDVTGCTMIFHVNDQTDTVQKENVKVAQEICSALHIPHLVFDFTEQFKTQVIDYFVQAYENAETPNPCFMCNKRIKFGAFLTEALNAGFDRVATGHYAKLVYDKAEDRYRLFSNRDAIKDQSYFLAYLNQAQLSKIIFPLQDLTKAEVKKIAEEKKLKTVLRKESQDICFVPDNDYAAIIKQFSKTPIVSGNFITADGKIIGTHRGIIHYTIGQRRGLHISTGEPMYVLSKDSKTNSITVAPRDMLNTTQLCAENINFISKKLFTELQESSVAARCKTRYRTKSKKCIMEKIDKSINAEDVRLSVQLLEPDFAVARGQALVIYNEGEPAEVLASGIIRDVKFETQ